MTLTDTAVTKLREALLKAVAALEVKSEPTVESAYGKSLEALEACFGDRHSARMEKGKPVVRLVKKGEWYLDSIRMIPWQSTVNFETRERLILDPLPPRPRRIVFEFVRHDYVGQKEWYRSPDGHIVCWPCDFKTADKYDIYRLVEGSL